MRSPECALIYHAPCRPPITVLRGDVAQQQWRSSLVVMSKNRRFSRCRDVVDRERYPTTSPNWLVEWQPGATRVTQFGVANRATFVASGGPPWQIEEPCASVSASG